MVCGYCCWALCFCKSIFCWFLGGVVLVFVFFPSYFSFLGSWAGILFQGCLFLVGGGFVSSKKWKAAGCVAP